MIREAIIRKIVERDLAGESLLEDEVRRDDELLHAAAIDDFGSWETALEYSGVRARDVGRSRELTAERTAQQLRRLCTTGYDLAAKVNRSRNRPLYDAALRHHGTWRAALTAAGQSLVYSEVCLENRDKAMAIRRTFGSWSKAIDQACD